MGSLSSVVNSQVVLLVAAIAVAILLVRLLFRVLNVGLGTILMIGAIVLLLQFVFDISPRELWFEISHLPQNLMRLAQSFA